eukprot:SAG11_NODE_7812_length_1093_cov_1.363179_2_plen_75_part_00
MIPTWAMSCWPLQKLRQVHSTASMAARLAALAEEDEEGEDGDDDGDGEEEIDPPADAEELIETIVGACGCDEVR